MRIGGKARLGIMVSLGILAGIGFVGLPSLLLTPTLARPTPAPTTRTNSTSVNALGSTSPTTLNGGSNATKTPIPAGDTQVTPGSLATLISLVVAPAVAISLVASVFVSRRSPKRAKSLPENG